jgi:hypothetical protein
MSSYGEDHLQLTDPIIAIVAISFCGIVIILCIITKLCTMKCDLVRCRKDTQSTLEQSIPMIQHP